MEIQINNPKGYFEAIQDSIYKSNLKLSSVEEVKIPTLTAENEFIYIPSEPEVVRHPIKGLGTIVDYKEQVEKFEDPEFEADKYQINEAIMRIQSAAVNSELDDDLPFTDKSIMALQAIYLRGLPLFTTQEIDSIENSLITRGSRAAKMEVGKILLNKANKIETEADVAVQKSLQRSNEERDRRSEMATNSFKPPQFTPAVSEPPKVSSKRPLSATSKQLVTAKSRRITAPQKVQVIDIFEDNPPNIITPTTIPTVSDIANRRREMMLQQANRNIRSLTSLQKTTTFMKEGYMPPEEKTVERKIEVIDTTGSPRGSITRTETITRQNPSTLLPQQSKQTITTPLTLDQSREILNSSVEKTIDEILPMELLPIISSRKKRILIDEKLEPNIEPSIEPRIEEIFEEEEMESPEIPSGRSRLRKLQALLPSEDISQMDMGEIVESNKKSRREEALESLAKKTQSSFSRKIGQPISPFTPQTKAAFSTVTIPSKNIKILEELEEDEELPYDPEEYDDDNESIMGEFIDVATRVQNIDLATIRRELAKEKQRIMDLNYYYPIGSPDRIDAQYVVDYSNKRVEELENMLRNNTGKDVIKAYYWNNVASSDEDVFTTRGVGPFETEQAARNDANMFLEDMSLRRKSLPRNFYSEAASIWVESVFNDGCCSEDDGVSGEVITLSIPSKIENYTDFIKFTGLEDNMRTKDLFQRQDTKTTRNYILLAQPWNTTAINETFGSSFTRYLRMNDLEDNYKSRTDFIRYLSPLVILGWNEQMGSKMGTARGISIPIYTENIYCGVEDTSCWGVTVAMYDAPSDIAKATDVVDKVSGSISIARNGTPSEKIQSAVESIDRAIDTIYPSAEVNLAQQPDYLDSVAITVQVPENPDTKSLTQLIYTIYGILTDKGIGINANKSILNIGNKSNSIPPVGRDAVFFKM